MSEHSLFVIDRGVIQHFSIKLFFCVILSALFCREYHSHSRFSFYHSIPTKNLSLILTLHIATGCETSIVTKIPITTEILAIFSSVGLHSSSSSSNNIHMRKTLQKSSFYTWRYFFFVMADVSVAFTNKGIQHLIRLVCVTSKRHWVKKKTT